MQDLKRWVEAEFTDLDGFTPLGQGGQKTVLGCRSNRHGDVVLKLINIAQDPELVKREILAVRSACSRRTPRILEDGVKTTPLGQVVWLVEEMVPGHSLRDVINRGVLQPKQIIRLLLDTLESLRAAEKAEIVHRDVKPENIIQHYDDSSYWLIDFGIARHLTMESLTPTHHPFGKITPGYAPPEQCYNVKREIDSRADLFALGVTAFEAATGTNPFRRGTRDPLEIMRRTERIALPPLDLASLSTNGLRDLIIAMTQKRREHRPRTVADAYDWAVEICGDEGVKAT
ncbi:MAG: hypothetical protein AMXMBFR82_29120 [Candidatus Hydrogenedentota bacterium]